MYISIQWNTVQQYKKYELLIHAMHMYESQIHYAKSKSQDIKTTFYMISFTGKVCKGKSIKTESRLVVNLGWQLQRG